MIRMLSRSIVLMLLTPILLAAFALTLVRYLWAISTNPARAWLIAIAVDDLGNVTFNGALGQTISSRAAHSSALWGRSLCWLLDTVNPGHCKRALTAADQNLQQD